MVEEFRVPSELAVGESHTFKLGKTLNKHDGHCQQKSSAALKLVKQTTDLQGLLTPQAPSGSESPVYIVGEF